MQINFRLYNSECGKSFKQTRKLVISLVSYIWRAHCVVVGRLNNLITVIILHRMSKISETSFPMSRTEIKKKSSCDFRNRLRQQNKKRIFFVLFQWAKQGSKKAEKRLLFVFAKVVTTTNRPSKCPNRRSFLAMRIGVAFRYFCKIKVKVWGNIYPLAPPTFTSD